MEPHAPRTVAQSDQDATPEHDFLRFIGTATTLVRLGAFTVLTDPNFLRRGERAYVGMGVSTRRLTDPAMTIDELPRLDLVLLSHHHGDHFDRVAAEKLDKDLPIVTEPHAADKLRSQGFRRAIHLATWDAEVFEKDGDRLTITAVPGKHAPMPLGMVVPPVMGSVVDFEGGDATRARHLRLYVTGDTLLHERLAEIPRRFPDIDLCLIHLGGTKIAGILLTMDADQGVRALQLICPRHAVPIHYDDYTLFRSPLEAFRQLADARLRDCVVHYLRHGDSLALDPLVGRPVHG